MGKLKMEPPARYTDGRPAYMGDKITVIATGEHAYLRVIGTRGYVTVYDASWKGGARVYHISEIEKGHRVACYYHHGGSLPCPDQTSTEH
jgi:hypothetical protein